MRSICQKHNGILLLCLSLLLVICPHFIQAQNLQHENVENKEKSDFEFTNYFQAPSEKWIFQHLHELGYDTDIDDNAVTCLIWQQEQYKYKKEWYANQVYNHLHQYRNDLARYYEAIHKFTYCQDNGITDVRKHLDQGVCDALELKPPGHEETQQRRNLRYSSEKPNGVGADLRRDFFANSSLSYLSNSKGWIEPLLPQLRHPNLCFHRRGDIETLDALNLDFLVHDFATMCRALKPTSRIVIFDLGASPKFWELESPIWGLLRVLQKFGFKVDHIYAYEKTDGNLREPVEQVYNRVPRHLHAAFHWIHTAVSTEEGHPLNPFTILEEEYRPDDLVFFKMDIGPSHHEEVLAQQLLNSTRLQSLVDHFYWEHKVHVHELSRHWGGQMTGSVKDSLELFAQLREKGVMAHYWV